MFSMARLARVVVPGIPHHIVQRGNRNQTVFFSDSDRYMYALMLRNAAGEYGVSFLSWCLMDNHVHLIAIPEMEKSFASCFRKAHSQYSYYVNSQYSWRGHLWQCRFHSSPLGPSYLYNAIRYVEQNPVRAGMTLNPWDYRWSSAGFHTGHRKYDLLANNKPDVQIDIEDWQEYLSIDPETAQILKIRKAVKKNNPVGRYWFLKRMEKTHGISAVSRERGRPRKYPDQYP